MNDYEIKKLYEEMEMYLIQSMKRNLNRHLKEEKEVGFQYTQWQAEKLKELKRYQNENKKIIGRYTLGLDKKISEHLQTELKQGSINAIKQYNKAMGKSLKSNKTMNGSFFKTNDRKVNALIKVVNNDLKKANTGALRMINDQYRQVIHKSAFFVGNGVLTEQQASKIALKELSQKKLTTLAIDEANKNFLAGGLNCIEYSDGRRVNLASYCQMAVRTANLRAQLMGEGDFRASIGRTLVKVTTHGGACKLCTKWQGKVLVDDVYSGGEPDGEHTLLSTAMKQGFLHPNCRHGITTYYPGLEEDDEEVEESSVEQEEVKQQMNYINRNIKKYNRLENGSLAHSNITKYHDLKRNWIEQLNKLDNPYYENNTKNDNNASDIDIENLLNDESIILSDKIVSLVDDVYNCYKSNGYENVGLINSNTGKRIGKIANIKSVSSVDYSSQHKKLMKKYNRELISIHNHPGNHPPSIQDIYETFQNDSLNGIIVITDDYIYYFIPDIHDLTVTKNNIFDFQIYFEEKLSIMNDCIYAKYPQISNNDHLDLVYKKIFDELGWKYGKKRKKKSSIR